MPLPTIVEIKTKVGSENIDSKETFEVDALAVAKDEVVCAGKTRTIDLYGGPKKDISFLHLKSDLYDRKPENGCGGKLKTAWIEYKFVKSGEGNAESSDGFTKLNRAEYFGGECAMEKLPDNVDALIIRNGLATDVKISVLLARAKMPVPEPAREITDMPVRPR